MVPEKTEVAKFLKDFFAMVRTQFGKKIRVLRRDNGTEFIYLKSFFFFNKVLCIKLQSWRPPNKIGEWRESMAALAHSNAAHALRFQGNLSKIFFFWGGEGECVTAEYLVNRTPSALLQSKTPFELFYGKLLLYSHFQCFDCLAFVYDHTLPKDKFCVIVGFVSFLYILLIRRVAFL